MLLKGINRLVKPFKGKLKFQRHFEYLNKVSLEGMNIGSGASPNASGEEVVLHQIKKELAKQDRSILFDVGANKGDYTLMLNRIFGPSSIIYAFEPSKKAFAALKQNIDHYDNILAFDFGLGDKTEKVNLFSNSEGSLLASIYKRKLDHFDIKMSHKEEIQLKTLDDFCTENKISRIDLLKLDVEGNEINTLYGAKSIIQTKNVKFIQFEFGGCNIDSRTYFQDFYYLLTSRYKIFRILQDGLLELTEYNESHEQFKPTNYLARLRY